MKMPFYKILSTIKILNNSDRFVNNLQQKSEKIS